MFIVTTYFFNDTTVATTAEVNQIDEDTQFIFKNYLNIDFLYHQLWPSFYCLCVMLTCYILSRLSDLLFDIVSFLLFPLAFLASLLPLFGGSYIFCMFLNFFIYLFSCTLCVSRQSDPSSSGVAIVYGHILIIGIGASVLIKLIYEAIKLLS